MNYYYVATCLPELHIGEPADITFGELQELFEANLSLADLEKVKTLRRYYDIFNIRFLLLKEPLDPYGNLDEVQLAEGMISGIGLPPYVNQFLANYSTTEERLSHFLKLFHAFFEEEITKTEGSLQKILKMERDFRIIAAAFRAKNLNRDIVRELKYENEDDPLVAQIIAQKDAKTFEPPFAYEDMKQIYLDHQNSPFELNKASIEFRFEAANGFAGMDYFSIERLIVYMYQLILVETWQTQNKEKGIQIIDNTVKEAL